MTTCLAHITPFHQPRHPRTRAHTSTPSRTRPFADGSKNLLRVLTGADAIGFPHHPRRRRTRRL